MKRVLLTGSKGVVGKAAKQGLIKHYKVIEFDLPDHNLTDYKQLENAVADVDVIIHCALHQTNGQTESWRSSHIDPENIQIELNVLQAAIACSKRLIMASSVHADDWLNYDQNELLTCPGSYTPPSQYGVHKLILEEQAKYYSQMFGLEAILLRLGGVSPNNSVKTEGREPIVWLSHRDLTNALIACIDADSVPNHFTRFYTISNNTGKVHSTENPFGWKPVDDSSTYL